MAELSYAARKRNEKIKAGLCAHTGCKRKHLEDVRCCAKHMAFYRERNRKYQARVKKQEAAKSKRTPA
jgi:hypothetical protein